MRAQGLFGTCVLRGKCNFGPVQAGPGAADPKDINRMIVRGARFGPVLWTGAALLTAGSLTTPCKDAGKREGKSVCDVELGRSCAWLKKEGSSTAPQSGSMFSPRYSPVLTKVERPAAKLEEKTIVTGPGEPVAINLN